MAAAAVAAAIAAAQGSLKTQIASDTFEPHV